MSKKNILVLVSFGCLITIILFISVNIMISQATKYEVNQGNVDTSDEYVQENTNMDKESKAEEDKLQSVNPIDLTKVEPWLTSNPLERLTSIPKQEGQDTEQKEEGISENMSITDSEASLETSVSMAARVTPGAPLTQEEQETSEIELITNSREVDYNAYVPAIAVDSRIEVALDIANPNINVAAVSAILFDAETKKVLYYKDPVVPVFPASTVKILTALVGLEWCSEEEEVTVGDEVKMMASDSTRAYLNQGQILTIRNILEGMLLPSGNDAAYVMAAYVGRKSLNQSDATREEAVLEFMRLVNEKAKEIGARNSCFKTPDGYDAIGQYTTAYDMGLIGIAAAENDTIIEISNKSKSRNIFVSGEDVTWYNTNALINQGSGKYYANAIGLKTGTSTMAGRCLVAAAESNGRKVICVIMNSTSTGRWSDAIDLLKYGLQ